MALSLELELYRRDQLSPTSKCAAIAGTLLSGRSVLPIAGFFADEKEFAFTVANSYAADSCSFFASPLPAHHFFLFVLRPFMQDNACL